LRRVKPATASELEDLVPEISQCVGRYRARQGLLVRDLENRYLTLASRDDSAWTI